MTGTQRIKDARDAWFRVDGIGVDVVHALLERPRTSAEVAERVRSLYEVDDEVADRDVRSFLVSAWAAGLVWPV